jgi:hypothetical protein
MVGGGGGGGGARRLFPSALWGVVVAPAAGQLGMGWWFCLPCAPWASRRRPGAARGAAAQPKPNPARPPSPAPRAPPTPPPAAHPGAHPRHRRGGGAARGGGRAAGVPRGLGHRGAAPPGPRGVPGKAGEAAEEAAPPRRRRRRRQRRGRQRQRQRQRGRRERGGERGVDRVAARQAGRAVRRREFFGGGIAVAGPLSAALLAESVQQGGSPAVTRTLRPCVHLGLGG